MQGLPCSFGENGQWRNDRERYARPAGSWPAVLGWGTDSRVTMTFRFEEIGERLRAYRMGSGLSAEEVAQRLRISRAALYRYEKGELTKIETIARLSELLNVSIPSLLGVGVEYVANALAFFERMRQIEEKAEHIIVLFGPITYLLTSDEYDRTLREVLLESIPEGIEHAAKARTEVEELMEVLRQRKETYRRRRPSVVSLIAASEMERFIAHGLIGTQSLTQAQRRARSEMARSEVRHIIRTMSDEPIGVQIGLVQDTLPNTSFQIFRQSDRAFVAVSPFRLGEQPNVRVGVAMITSAAEALSLHENVASSLWRRALKGIEAAEFVGRVLERAEREEH